VALACRRGGRKPEEVRLIAVTKGVSPPQIKEAVDAGISELGENRLQEAEGKIGVFKDRPVNWHFIGRIQRNKVKKMVNYFHWIHSLDSLQLAEAVDRHAELLGKSMPVLLQLNLTGKETQGGIKEEELFDLIERMNQLSHLDLRGLMVIGPLTSDQSKIRKVFKRLREIKELVNREMPAVGLSELSMGMSNDYEIAIEEGATMIRLGRAIFGERSY